MLFIEEHAGIGFERKVLLISSIRVIRRIVGQMWGREVKFSFLCRFGFTSRRDGFSDCFFFFFFYRNARS